MSTSKWMAEVTQTCNRTLRLILEKGNRKYSSVAIVALAALVGEAYIIIQAYEKGKSVQLDINDVGTGTKNHSYFFWLALGIMVACANNLIIAGLATLKNVYLKTNRERNTKSMWPLFAAYVCVMGLMAGILPAALKRYYSPSAFAAVSLLSIYFQSILWAVILAWRDVDKPHGNAGPNPTMLAR